ncbi:uncharacterized protein RAG0_06966 [Rhynchosporium agropyri]|uniref:Uncharacterized protein n=1 Tax=Rhynchosporium agropyri TaxID=914238 RepID=A0A1E1KJE5_9HELO|nr:uncharacterized protein RAG0_06966 [Rhynchosporium agropyri]
MSGWLGSGSWVEKSFGPVLSWDLEAVWNWTNKFRPTEEPSRGQLCPGL